MRSLIVLLTQFSAGIATSVPEKMTNWRMIAVHMIAVNLNSPLGWVIAILGMVLSLIAVYFLVKNKSTFGTSRWVMIMLGVFSATLVVTWHSHFHMAMMLIPFLIYCSLSQMLSQKIVFFWVIAPPLILIASSIIVLLLLFLTKMNIINLKYIYIRYWLPGFSGFLFNLVFLFSALKYFYGRRKTSEIPDPVSLTK
jgi:hypothetical protein